ncbi:hypothetical protein [Paenibacillus sp. SI8]|uniref:hypothetical protein n=1 Tax=unclassified Paenibacillus TaxID=185978 RepID=UPI0034660F7A
MKFRAVSDETKFNYMIWSIKQEIHRENKYLGSLGYDPTPILDAVKQHIDTWDPLQLLALNSPSDEYDGETRTIAIYITKHLEDLDASSLSSAINNVFRKSLQEEFHQQAESIDIANQILHTLRAASER